MSKIKIKIISNHTKYKKDQIVEMEEKETTSLLTTGKAIRVKKEAEIASKNKKGKM